MKKVFVILMCCLGLAFTSCKPEEKPYEKFVGNYLGNIELQGKLTSPLFPGVEYELDGSTFELRAKIEPGTADDKVIVTFTIQDESYTTTGTVSEEQIEFGTLSYTYVEEPSTFTVFLNLTGTLSNQNLITLTGPYTGNGDVTMEGMTLVMNAAGNVTGELNKLAE